MPRSHSTEKALYPVIFFFIFCRHFQLCHLLLSVLQSDYAADYVCEFKKSIQYMYQCISDNNVTKISTIFWLIFLLTSKPI